MLHPLPFAPLGEIGALGLEVHVSCTRCHSWRAIDLQDDRLRNRQFAGARFACRAWASLCVIEPVKETGMTDYRLDEPGHPQHHPAAVARVTGQRHRHPPQPRKSHNGNRRHGRPPGQET